MALDGYDHMDIGYSSPRQDHLKQVVPPFAQLPRLKTLGVILQFSFPPPPLFFSFLILLLTPHLVCQQSFQLCFKNEARN